MGARAPRAPSSRAILLAVYCIKNKRNLLSSGKRSYPSRRCTVEILPRRDLIAIALSTTCIIAAGFPAAAQDVIKVQTELVNLVHGY